MFITKPFIRDRKIRFALVGCGRISANHFDALEKHTERAELVGVCDVDADALGRAVERTGAKGYKSLDALLAGTDADIVILSLSDSVETGELRLDPAKAGAWLRCLTDIRLTLASRLGIESEDQPPSQDSILQELYDWLGFLQNSLVEAVDE